MQSNRSRTQCASDIFVAKKILEKKMKKEFDYFFYLCDLTL